MEAMQELFRMNSDFMIQMKKMQEDAVRAMIAEMQTALTNTAQYSSGARGDLRDRLCREVGSFKGEEAEWQDWSLKFRAVVKEANLEIFDCLKWAEAENDPIDEELIEEEKGEQAKKFSTTVYNRLVHHLHGPALVIHQMVKDENGFEVWRLLNKRFCPNTPMRGLQLMMRVMAPGKIVKGNDIQMYINRWEANVSALERDYNEKVSDRMKIGIIIKMVPDDLQDAILQHADRLKEYRLVKEKVIALVDARARLKDPDAMDTSALDDYDAMWNEEEQPIDALGKGGEGIRCYRCGGLGHRANQCATPYGKGTQTKGDKGKGKGDFGKGDFGKGKGKGDFSKGKGKGDFGDGRQRCTYCGKTGHTAANCWTLHPNQIPWRRTAAVDWEYGDDGMDRDIGQVSIVDPESDWKIAAPPGLSNSAQAKPLKLCSAYSGHCKRECNCCDRPPRMSNNRFEALAEEEIDEDDAEVQALELEVDDRPVAHVAKSGKLVPAGKGKITIDSGAAESVMPKSMLPKEPLREGEAKKSGVRYVAANGAKMDNLGEKRVKFRSPGDKKVNGITFQVTDVAKPLASVSRILDKGNRVVFSRFAEGSYIENPGTGEWWPLKEEKGTFVLEVELMEPEGSSAEDPGASGFTRPGQ